MKKIGMIVAVEIDAVLTRYKGKLENINCRGYEVLKYSSDGYELYILDCGPGQIAAASGTQFLIDNFDVELFINFGIVGALTADLSLTKTCIVESVIHYEFDISSVDNCDIAKYPHYDSPIIELNKELIDLALSVDSTLKKVVCASGDKFIATASDKTNLNTKFKADIVEMELAAIVMTCDRNNIPCLSIKTVSDSIDGGPEEYLAECDKTASLCLEIVEKIILGL